MGSEGGAVVRALASHQFDFGSNPGVDTIYGLSLLLVLSFAPRGFSPGTAVDPSPPKPTFANSNSTKNQVEEEPLCGCVSYISLFLPFIIIIINVPAYTLNQNYSKGPTIWLLREMGVWVTSEKNILHTHFKGKNFFQGNTWRKNILTLKKNIFHGL